MQDVARLPGSRMTRIRKSTVCAWPERAEKDTGPVCGGPKRGTKRGGGRRKMKGREKKKKKKREEGFTAYDCECVQRCVARQGRSLIFWLALLFQEIEGSAPNYYK